jgi:hypothetical protein
VRRGGMVDAQVNNKSAGRFEAAGRRSFPRDSSESPDSSW